LVVWLAAVDARHGLVKAAANLVGSGERYAYALHLLVYHLQMAAQTHMDIMCMWDPWLRRMVTALLQDPPADAGEELTTRILELRRLIEASSRLLTTLRHGSSLR
jgi:hypothetical protein